MNRIAIASLLMLGQAAFADEETKPQRQKGEWVISNGFGASSTAKSDINVRQTSSNTNLTYHNIKWVDEADEWPPVYNFRVLYWRSPEATLGYGIEFVHLKYIVETDQVTQVNGTLNGSPYSQIEPVGNTLPMFTITNGLNILNAVVVGRKRMQVSDTFPSGRTQLYAGAGIGVAIPHPVTRFLNGPGTGRYEDGGFAWHLLTGVEHRFSDRLGLFVEFKVSDYPANVDMSGGATGSAHLRTGVVTVGTTIRF